jgi:ribonuclease HII
LASNSFTFGYSLNYDTKPKILDRLKFEKELWEEDYTRIMGLDEAGRGCLSGPVVAAGVILKPNTSLPGVKDSKQLSLEQRLSFEGIIKKKTVYWTVQWCDPEVIDQINILWASLTAMQKCSEQNEANPDYLLIDGNRYVDTLLPHQCLVGGDDRSQSIAAASVLAKVYRDTLMKELHQEYPVFGWDTNVGYPTAQHFAGLQKYGITEYHRRSFRLRTKKEWNGLE